MADDAYRRAGVVLGSDHLITLVAAGVLGLVLARTDRGDRAAALGLHTLRTGRRALGEDHLVTLIAAIAVVAATQDAGGIGDDTRERLRRVLGVRHPLTRILAEIMGELPPAETLGL